MIKNLLFDFGGVIFSQNPLSEPIKRFEQLGFVNVRDFTGDHGQRGFFLELEKGLITEDEFIDRLEQECHRKLTYKEVQNAWLGFVRDVPLERLQHLLWFKERYNVCMLSNTNAFVQNWARSDNFDGHGHSIHHYFDTLYCSNELHEYKPDAAIFEKVLALGNMERSETIFIDDSMRNIEGARAVGIPSFHVTEQADWFQPLKDFIETQNK